MLFLLGCGGGGLLRGELRGFDDLVAPEDTPKQQLAWDLLRGHVPRHPALADDDQDRALQVYVRYGLGAWDSLPADVLEGLPGAFAAGPPMELDLPGPVTVPSVDPVEGIHTVPLSLPAGAEVRAWVDTGAAFTTLTASTAERAGLSPVQGPTWSTVSIPELRVGEVTMRNVRALVLDDAELTFESDTGPLTIDAILGWDVLARLAVTLDAASRTVTLAPPSDEPDEDLLVWWGGPLVRGRSDDVALVFALDSGSTGSYLTERGARRLGLRLESGATGSFAGVGGTLEPVGLLPGPVEVQVGTRTLTFEGEVYGDSADWGPIPVDGCLGVDLLNAHGPVRLDFSATRIGFGE